MYFKKEKLFDEELFVSAVIDNTQGIFAFKQNEIIIKKLINKENKVLYYINDILKSKDDYQNFLDMGRITKLQSYKFLSSRNVTNLAQLSGQDLFDIIKEFSGYKIYENKKKESLIILDKTCKLKRK